MKSSYHFISGDSQRNPAKKVIYRLLQRLEQPVYGHKDSRFPVKAYVHPLEKDTLYKAFGEQGVNGSPARVLSYSILLHAFAPFFGRDKSIIDLGCGAGEYAGHFLRNFGYKKYDGYDICPRPQWKDLEDSKTHFHSAELGKVTLDVSTADIIFSQSALEHIENDLAAIRNFRSTHDRILRHIHSVPALKSWRDYRYHGYRRYALANIDKLLTSPDIENIEIFMSGNAYTRELRAQQRAAKNGTLSVYLQKPHIALPVPYDPQKTMAENLESLGERIIPETPLEASTFTVTFTQRIKATSF